MVLSWVDSATIQIFLTTCSMSSILERLQYVLLLEGQKVLRSLTMLVVLCLKIVIIIPNMFSFVEVTNSAQLHLQLLSHNSILVALSFCVSPTKF